MFLIKVEEACVATLMEVHAGRGCEGDEAAKLLVEECLKGKAELVVDWVRGLPGQLVACLCNNKEEEEKEGQIDRGKEALALADSCLTLAKASNAELAPVFLARLNEIKGALVTSEHKLSLFFCFRDCSSRCQLASSKVGLGKTAPCQSSVGLLATLLAWFQRLAPVQ